MIVCVTVRTTQIPSIAMNRYFERLKITSVRDAVGNNQHTIVNI